MGPLLKEKTAHMEQTTKQVGLRAGALTGALTHISPIRLHTGQKFF